jgi:hypothetical protein
MENNVVIGILAESCILAECRLKSQEEMLWIQQHHEHHNGIKSITKRANVVLESILATEKDSCRDKVSK